MNTDFVKDKRFQLGVTAVTSAAAGFGAAYALMRASLMKQFAQVAVEEIEDAKEFYRRQNKVDEFETAVSAAEALGAVVTDLGYSPTDEEVDLRDAVEEFQETNLDPVRTREGVVVKNIFSEPEPEVEEEPLPPRDTGRPYVISHDEFMSNDDEYEQVQVTYWEGDDVMADDRSQPIPDVESLVGEENLVRFGLQSKDRNIVYVRNEEREMDFEIVRSTGKFAQEVFGFPDTDDDKVIKHSDRRAKRRRTRDEDD